MMGFSEYLQTGAPVKDSGPSCQGILGTAGPVPMPRSRQASAECARSPACPLSGLLSAKPSLPSAPEEPQVPFNHFAPQGHAVRAAQRVFRRMEHIVRELLHGGSRHMHPGIAGSCMSTS